ncbi:TetR/AcrR family transcriptional regulator [Saccharibacillus sp. CPCC 101409]|uniref:TetR/AcrR family transcriptional regulator n=1 Tax=Saccharibacillus sp. CPCC 101409 TaxID=3058041 RepID=UPI0026726621|nr:TetR/AcrR family transcriptional regulator [Saccharibacillus sp. CPCC 101409]MDO3410220.1 TetR/AcrR family transcriptional regulator [Saccharibacillus sp. CPCC 101409]
MNKNTPSGNSPGKRRSGEAYRELILEAARSLMREHGPESVSMHHIARKAGIGQASLYRRYADKGEICSALLRDSSERFLLRLETGLSENENGTQLPPGRRLEQTIGLILDFIDEHADLLNLIKAEFTGKHQLTQFEHPFFLRLGAIGERLFESLIGQESSSPEVRFAASAFVSQLSPDLYLYRRKTGLSKEDIRSGTIRLFSSNLSS